MLADTVDIADLQSRRDEFFVDVDQIAFVEPGSQRLLDACRATAGDEEEDLVVRVDEVEQLSAGVKTGVRNIRMSAFNDDRSFSGRSIAFGDCDEGIDFVIETIAQRPRALADGDDRARHVGRCVDESLGRASVEGTKVDGFELLAQCSIVARAYFTERL